jgi:hypothetical protein
MAKYGRNDPCPCGSGKKYKRCCLEAQAPSSTLNLAATATVAPEVHDDLCDCCIDALNERADRALDLLLEDRLDDAEVMARDLLRDFPREVEGTDLLSMVAEARGDLPLAITLLRQAIALVRVHPGHDGETRVLMHQRLRELLQAA